MSRRVWIPVLLGAAILSGGRTMAGSPGQVTSAPPEIKALIEAFISAANGTPAQWEAMAKERFAPALLKRDTPAVRAALQQQLKKTFGTISRDRVLREGPDAPLEINIKGSTGATGVIRVTIENAAPFRITEVTLGKPEGGDAAAKQGALPPVNASMSPDALSSALDGYLSGLAAADTFSGAVLVARDGRAVFARGYGFADRGNRVANTPETRFNLGSINKSFTQLAIRQLAAQGRLALTDTLGKFFPDYPQEVSRTATVQQLLGHTGGLSDFFGGEFDRTAKDRFRSNADYFQLVSRLPPLFAPGARNQYCNGCYIALGAIIERASDVTYEQYVRDHIFAPAGMHDTGYPQTDAIEPRVALGYTRRGADGTLRSNVFSRGAAGSAAGGGYSTVADLLAYVNGLRDGRFGQPGGEAAGNMGIAGGAPGINASLEADGRWTVVVLCNLDPPAASALGTDLMKALGAGR